MKYCIKLALSGIILFLIFRQIDIQVALHAVRKLPLYIPISVVFLLICGTSLAAYRWSLIMKSLGCRQPLSFYLMSYYKGCFFNQGLPTSIGGDALRILDCSRILDNKEDAFYGTFIDRIIGLSGLLLLNLFALLFNMELLPVQISTLLILLTLCLLIALISLFFLRNVNILKRLKFLAYIPRLSQRYRDVYATPVAILNQLSLSIFIHLITMFSFYMLGNGLGLEFDLAVYITLVPPVLLLTILPISLAGWGIRESAMIGFFLLIGADKSLVLLFSIIFGLLLLISSLPGFAIFLFQKRHI
ncbi:lysylphosphatidylglycerol synthase transmembrane domain-containing protein [Desulfogranum japonicum]|uniref:lysylphosphatidylglycerol synthase transmembrane domain-containing protein n=1 Tax=Desulfogranum japonicum TaxID=231447 RepID=UPI0003F56E08|nr:lysylphosphatidylglycerol synthase transmembrane domain-containing protein [Desulfogranum japonicum]